MGPIANTREGALRRNGIADRDDIGGGNAFLHCVISCDIHASCSICDNNWDNRENNGATLGDRQDLANNASGRKVTGDCWNGCLTLWEEGSLTCEAPKGGALVKCPPPAQKIRRMPPLPPPDVWQMS
jgi:hypothetical protein